MAKIEFNADEARNVEAVYQTPDVVAQRAATLARLNLQPGAQVLDIGTGPGLLLAEIAMQVGREGRAVGVDISEAMLTMAKTRCAALPQVEVQASDASTLDFPPACFDAIVVTQVYEYVEDIPPALAAAHRVLKPGGRLLIIDTDWDSLVWHTADRPRLHKIATVWDRHLAHPCLPSALLPQLKKAGFAARAPEILPMLSAGWQPHSYAGFMTRAILNFVRQHVTPEDELSPAALDAFADEQARLQENGGFFFSVNRYLFEAIRR